jgi:hypothetical protein
MNSQRHPVHTLSVARSTDHGPSGVAADLARELLENLSAHQSQLRGLLDTAGAKMQAIRSADATGLNTCTAREARLLEEILRTEQQRRVILARLAQSMPEGGVKNLTLGEIAGLFPEPMCSSIRARMRAMGQVATELRERNRVAEIVARDLQRHVREIFAAMCGAGRRAAGYGPSGNHGRPTTEALWDAVG